MSKNFQLRPPSKKLYINIQPKSKKFLKKKSNSQMKYAPIPDIITQMKPYLNNINSILNPPNPHQVSLTPFNHSKILPNEFLLPKKSSEFSNKKTLILDLDETLVHSSFTPFENNDIVLNVDFDGMIYDIYVLVRPGAEYFIKNISKYYELVIFTASLSNYASPLLDILDKEDNIKYRLYRENCTFMNGIYIKDLKKLNRNLKDLVIVDNSPLAYTLDIDNGLPIKTWYEDKNDIELFKISGILEFLAKTGDVRNYIRKFVKQNEIAYEEAMNFIKTFENKKNKINKSFLKSENNHNNTSNYENNINDTSSANNISNSRNKNNINNMKKMNNIDDNICFNLKPVNFCESKLKKDIEIEKNFIKYDPNPEIQKKSLKAAVLYNSQNKKNNFISLQDIALIKKRNKILENKKINDKQKNKNNNYFRLKRKKEIKPNENNDIIININDNSKIKPIIPITLSTSSTPNIKNFLFSTTKNLLSRHNNIFHKKDEKFNLKLKNNYINMLQDKKEKKKYSNILRQMNKDNLKNNLENKNILKYEKLGIGDISKSKLRVSSSIASHRNYTPLNVNKRNNKIFMSFHVQRSKSSGHFFDNNNIIPKTPNDHIIMKNEKRKFDNFFGGINLGNTSRYNILGNNLNIIKQRRVQTAKKLIN